VLLVFLLPCPACIGVSFSGQRGAGSEGASGRASMLAVLPSAGLLSGARTVQVAAQLALSGLKHARHPLAAGQGQTCPSLRASDANKAPGQRPPQPFGAPLSACGGTCPLTAQGWRMPTSACAVGFGSGKCGWSLAFTHDPSHAWTFAHATSGAKQGCGGSWRGALLAPSSATARWACAQRMLRHLTGRICLNEAAGGRVVSYAAPPCCEQRRGVTPQA
jgi:hypothetical protein